MLEQLIPQLICPNCGHNILNLINNKLICNNCNAEFEIIEKVPILLNNNDIEKVSNSELHKIQNSEFRYVEHYQIDANEYDYFQHRTGATEHSERRVREYIKSVVPKNIQNILDVGCGSAWCAKIFCNQGVEVVSLDITVKNTSEALKRYPFDNHYAVVADAFNLPFQKQSFDCIIASEIIEHVPQPDKFIESLFKVLKPNGKLIITTPYKEKLNFSLCIHCNKMTPQNAHIHSFDEQKLISLYSENDLKNVKYYIFGNKILIHLRTYKLLQYFSFTLWRFIDVIFNKLRNASSSILIIYEKK